MMRLIVPLLTCLFAQPVWAQAEVHVLSVAQGWSEQGDLWAVPTVRVQVDREGAWVTLVLMDRGPVKWEVTLTDGTRLEQIIIAGEAPNQSELSLQGLRFEGAQRLEAPVVLAPLGSTYRDVLVSLAAQFDVDRLASFQGRYSSPSAGFSVAGHQDDTRLEVDRLAEFVVADAPTPTPWPSGDSAKPPQIVDNSVVWNGRHYEPTANVPPVLFPMDAVVDPQSGQIYLMSLGGSGYVYAIDIASGAWSVLADQSGYDGARMLLDGDAERLVMTGAFGRPGEIRTLGFDGTVSQIKIPVLEFPGLTDLYAYGRDQPVPLQPVGMTGDWLWVEATRDETGAYRRYGVHLTRAEVVLVAYSD